MIEYRTNNAITLWAQTSPGYLRRTIKEEYPKYALRHVDSWQQGDIDESLADKALRKAMERFTESDKRKLRIHTLAARRKTITKHETLFKEKFICRVSNERNVDGAADFRERFENLSCEEHTGIVL